MAREKNHAVLLQRITGEGGDYYIGTQAVSDKKFSHIKIANNGATLVGVQIGNQDVTTARNYPASMPGGYLMCAGGQNYFNHIELSAGSAQGIIIPDTD